MKDPNKARHFSIPIIVCTIASSFYIYDFILRVMPEAMAHSLMRDLHIGARGLGILASLFFWGYTPMQIPCGMFYDRFSARRILTFATLLSALAALGSSYTSNFALIAFYRFVIGFMTSFAFVGALVVGAKWFRGQYFALYTGLVQFLGCLGAIIGITPIAHLTDLIGWRRTTFWIAAVGLLLALLIGIFVKDRPHHTHKKNSVKLRHIYRESFSHVQTWWVALFGFAIWGPVTVFATTWGVSYLHDALHLSKINASNHISIIWWTIAFGGPLIGWLSKHLETRRWPMVLCSISGLIASTGILYLHSPSPILLNCLLIGFGIGTSALVIAFGLVTDLQPPEAVGAIVGFVNMAVIFAGITLLPAVGFILQHLWQGHMVDGAPIYSHQSYQIALLSLPCCFLLALITSFLIKETHCKQTHEY